MYVSFSQYGKRYLPAERFLDLCKDLEIKLVNGNTDEEWLQFLEKQKILFPEFRVVKPIWYLNYSLKYNFVQPEKIKSKKWKEANRFYEKLES